VSTIEVGAVGQNLQLMANALDLGCVPCGDFPPYQTLRRIGLPEHETGRIIMPLGHLLQMNRAFGKIEQRVCERRPAVTHWTVDVDAKMHEVYGQNKEGAAKSYNGIYSLQPMYGFVHETDEMIHCELRSGNTHPGAGGTGFCDV
jgi:hypothetical protein